MTLSETNYESENQGNKGAVRSLDIDHALLWQVRSIAPNMENAMKFTLSRVFFE